MAAASAADLVRDEDVFVCRMKPNVEKVDSSAEKEEIVFEPDSGDWNTV